MRLFRLLKIASVASRFRPRRDGARTRAERSPGTHRQRPAVLAQPVGAACRAPAPGAGILGPIFVKFGQVLSTRRDLMPPDICRRTGPPAGPRSPFDSALALQEIEKPMAARHTRFCRIRPGAGGLGLHRPGPFRPLARRDGGHEVAVKILRPNMLSVIEHDLALMDNLAMLLEKLWPGRQAPKPREWSPSSPNT